ncbi:MAG: organoarsenical effux MFS transporter ArsJ [Actinomycetota bacterium]|nr:organoarsenical effux MFS transporter ArsJ [Actinomycetota bacterium]
MNIRTYSLVTGAYWSLTLTDGALRMLVLLHFHELGYGPLELSFLFLAYEFMGVITNLFGGWAGAKSGLDQTLKAGLSLQILALTAISFVDADWSKLLSVIFVMTCQALSGIAKDLTKMSSKSAVRFVVPDDDNDPQQSLLFKWVAVLTGSKNALKGAGFFIGGALLSWLNFRTALLVLACLVMAALLSVLAFLNETIGKAEKPKRLRLLTSIYPAVNRLSLARFFLFGSRDIWFVVALPIFLDEDLGWSYEGIGGFLAAWVIGYGLIQSGTPAFLKIVQGTNDVTSIAKKWAFALFVFTSILALFVANSVAKNIVVVVGLLVFGFLFALNSSLHSFLILAYTDEHDDVAVTVGFYYAANAAGRLIGTLLSGLTYLWGGLTAALFVSAGFLFVNWVLSLTLPLKAST